VIRFGHVAAIKSRSRARPIECCQRSASHWPSPLSGRKVKRSDDCESHWHALCCSQIRPARSTQRCSSQMIVPATRFKAAPCRWPTKLIFVRRFHQTGPLQTWPNVAAIAFKIQLRQQKALNTAPKGTAGAHAYHFPHVQMCPVR